MISNDEHRPTAPEKFIDHQLRRQSDAPLASTGVLWQRLVLGVSCVAVALMEAASFAQAIFAAGRMTRVCGDANVSSSSSSLVDDCSCDNATYRSDVYDSSIVSEWDLACGRAPLLSLYQSSHIVGFMMAMPSCGMLADRFGRRPMLLVTAPLTALAMLCTALADGLTLAIVARLVTGFGNGGFYMTLYVLSKWG